MLSFSAISRFEMNQRIVAVVFAGLRLPHEIGGDKKRFVLLREIENLIKKEICAESFGVAEEDEELFRTGQQKVCEFFGLVGADSRGVRTDRGKNDDLSTPFLEIVRGADLWYEIDGFSSGGQEELLEDKGSLGLEGGGEKQVGGREGVDEDLAEVRKKARLAVVDEGRLDEKGGRRSNLRFTKKTAGGVDYNETRGQH